MATIRERLVYAIDVVTDRAQTGFKGLKSSVADAEGAVGKFKAGASSALASVQANAGTLALAGGSALVAFGAKSVAAFQETAIAAGKFSDATGLAVEDASRLIEVAGDVGVEVGTIESAITRMNQAAAKGDLAKFGVELQRTADGTVDVNETFLETIRVLNGIADPTERALAAQKIFGKGYKEVAEIIFDSASNVEKKLADVSKSKVIDDKELEKARKFRDLMDDLRDKLENVGIVGGETFVTLVEGVDSWFDSIAAAGDAFGDFIRHGNLDNTHTVEQFQESERTARDFDRALLEGLTTFQQVREAVLGYTGDAHAANSVALEWARTQKEATEATEEDAAAIVDLGDKAANAGPKIGDMAGALQDVADKAAADAEEALGKVAAAAQAVADAVDTAFDDIDARFRQQDLLADIADGWEDIAESAKEAMTGGADERRKYERDVRDQRRAVLDLLDSINSIPPDRKIRLSTEIETGSLQTVMDIAAQLAGGISVPVSFNPQSGFSGATFGAAPGVAPQLQFTGQTAPPAGTTNVTNIFPVGSDPRTQYVDAIINARRNGNANRV